MSPNVCPPCHFHTAGYLQGSHREQCKGWKWHASPACWRIHSYSHKTHECCNFNDHFSSCLRRNRGKGLPQLGISTAKASLSKAGWIFPRFQKVKQSVPSAFRHIKSMFLENMNYLQLPATTRGGQQSVD